MSDKEQLVEPAEGVTQRKGGNIERSEDEVKNAMVDAVFQEASKRAPDWLAPHLKKVGPLVGEAATAVAKLEPYYVLAQEKYQVLRVAAEPYHPEDILPMFFGLCLMFFGGSFVTLIATVEAIRICGYHQIKGAVQDLLANYKKVQEESKKDDEEDKDNDGVADVLQIEKSELMTRKLLLVLRSVDPNQVTSALTGLYAAFVAVLATLQTHFARVIALGNSIGDFLTKPALKYFEPALSPAVPEEYRKWVPLVISYTCKSIGVSLAWTLQRLIAAVHSAVRGSEMFINAFTHYTKIMGLSYLSEGFLDDYLAYFLAFLGCYYQISYGFALPWLLYIPMFPLVIAEWLLTTIVAWF